MHIENHDCSDYVNLKFLNRLLEREGCKAASDPRNQTKNLNRITGTITTTTTLLLIRLENVSLRKKSFIIPEAPPSVLRKLKYMALKEPNSI